MGRRTTEVMIHYSEDKRMLEYGLMKSYPGIFCFSTTRHGGYSTGEYASFNCNNYCGDVMENILKKQKSAVLFITWYRERTGYSTSGTSCRGSGC